MIRIPAGKFLRGDHPQSVHIDEFWLDERPVTNEDFWKFLERSGYLLNSPYNLVDNRIIEFLRKAKDKSPDHPVTMITWFDALAYATWAQKRLPSADEWERAARGTEGRLFPWGNVFRSGLCNSRETGLGHTTPVCKYPGGRSSEGCFDMVGNVFEWVNDWTGSPRFSAAPFSEKVNRGGSFNRWSKDLECWYYESDPPDARMMDVGFRCAWTQLASGPRSAGMPRPL